MLFYVPDLHQAWLRGLHAWELTESLAKLQEMFSFPLCRWGMSLQKNQYLTLSDTELRSSTPASNFSGWALERHLFPSPLNCGISEAASAEARNCYRSTSQELAHGLLHVYNHKSRGLGENP